MDSSRASTIWEKPTSARKRAFSGRADVALGGGVQVDGRQVQFQQAHVLDDEGVHAGVVKLVDQLARRFQLGVVQDGVEGGVDAGVVAVGECRQAGDVGHRVAGVVARAEGRAADVHRVRAVQDGLPADVGGLGRGEEFEGSDATRPCSLSRAPRHRSCRPSIT
jgi:hypothetical protein